MLEALGQYKDALKDVKSELKDLEKEAKAIEKKGGIVPQGLKDKLASGRGERNRLEDMLQAQKATKADERRLRQTRSRIRRAFTDPIGTATDAGLNALANTPMGRRAIAHAGRLASRLGSRLAQPAFLGISGGAILTGGAAVAGAVKLYADAKIAQEKFRARGAEGLAQTEGVFAGLGKEAAFGGATASNLQQIIASSRADAIAARKAVDNASITNIVKTMIIGGTNAGQDMEDKVAQSQARRTIKAQRMGSGYGDSIDVSNIRRKRSQQYRNEMYNEMGYINTTINKTLDMGGSTSTEFVDATGWYLTLLTLGQYRPNEITSVEAVVSEKMKNMGEAKWEESRKAELSKWNDTASLEAAIIRADAHEAQNAVTAFQTDQLTRGLTWSLQ